MRSGSLARSPSTVLTTMGKNAMSAAMVTLGQIVKPSHSFSTGAIAKSGMFCKKIITG